MTDWYCCLLSRSVDGGASSPEGPDVLEVTQNNVAGQVYGTGTPTDVFV